MRAYELMVIVDGALEESVVDQVLTLVRDQASAAGATVVKVDRWGKRRFAYELDHRWEGYYVVIEAVAEPGTMADVHRLLSLADEVVRHKVIRIPDAVAGRARPAESAPVAASGTRSRERAEQP